MAEAASDSVIVPAETTQDDRTMAVLTQVLQVVGGWIAPLIIFFIRRQSRFVSFHSLQVLFLELVYMAIYVVLVVVWISSIGLVIIRTHGADNHPFPAALFIVLPLLWLALMGLWVVRIVIAVVYAVKAGRGEWAEYPVLGGLARRVLKIGPGGAPTS